jgi:prepilin-type N-terminal cleavage/methylation domain-containing protein
MNRKGFTLVEIMIVVAIIALLAAIAIPNLLRARLNANEAATIEAMKTVCGAANSFASVNQAGFPPSLAAMSPTGSTPPYLDATFTDPTTRNGYTITYTFNGVADAQGNYPDGFWVTAAPTTRGTTGSRDFYVDQAGVVCASPANTAGVTVAYAAGVCTAPDLPIQ